MNPHPLWGVLAAYLLGSIPFGLLFARGMAGIDPRTGGSRNIGFTNVLRVAGKAPAILTLLGDGGKGLMAIVLTGYMTPAPPWLWGSALAVVAGHIFPLFLRFKGGKGVATGLGAIIGIDPLVGGLTVLIWLGAVGVWRHSSLGAIIAFSVLPLLILFFHRDFISMGFSFILSGPILIKHKGNMERLLAGTEPRIGR